MIFGDPYKFAIQFDFVDEWLIPDEGIFNLIINGYHQPNALPNQSVTILDCFDSLNARYFHLNQKKTFSNLFNLDCNKLYLHMENILERIISNESNETEEDFFESSQLSISETIINRKYSWLFYSENKEKIIFLDFNNNPSEIILNKGYCCTTINQALSWAKNYYINENRFSNI